MRKWLIFLSICVCCTSKEKVIEKSITDDIPEREEWITYDGVVRSEVGNDIKIELSLLQNSVGMESRYKTEEEYISSQDDRLLTNRQGKYSILYGLASEMVITLDASAGNSLGWQTGKGYSINPQMATDKLLASAKVGQLIFKTGRNIDELIQVGENSNPLTEDNRYTLNKRSILFTVEGFVTFEPTVTDFFEFNTRENWVVAQAGSYGEVKKTYVELATEKHEGIYLKAVAFYIEEVDETGAEVRNLVIKKIIAMKSHQEHIASR